MASAFGHAAAGLSIVAAISPAKDPLPAWFWLLAAALAIFPDADVIGFRFGVPYGSVWGHRGFTHSLIFAAGLATGVALMLRNWGATHKFPVPQLWSCIFLVIFSHPLIDAMTTGGLGVGFFTPFHPRRYFFPFRPILVSPIGVREFFNDYGFQVLKSEAFWIGIPGLLLALAIRLVRRLRAPSRSRLPA